MRYEGEIIRRERSLDLEPGEQDLGELLDM